jgi:hypothetical protein
MEQSSSAEEGGHSPESGRLLATSAEEDPPQEEPPSLSFIDHFSVGAPSSTIRFRQKRVVLYGFDHDEQILLEEDIYNKKRVMTVKRFNTASLGLWFLRAAYSLVALLVVCFLWAFWWLIIIFLFLNMAAEGGTTQARPDVNTTHVLAAIFSIPVFLYGMASICAMGGTFIQDTWKGNSLFQQLMGFSNAIIMESICVVIFLGIPGLTMAITLLAKSDNWWEISAKVWVCCVLFFIAVFALLVVICEVKMSLELIQIQHPDEPSPWKWIQQAILTTQIMFYSGYQKEEFLIDGMDNKQLVKTKTSLYSRLTLCACCTNKLFEKLDPPVRSYSPDEVRYVQSQDYISFALWLLLIYLLHILPP